MVVAANRIQVSEKQYEKFYHYIRTKPKTDKRTLAQIFCNMCIVPNPSIETQYNNLLNCDNNFFRMVLERHVDFI